MTPGRISEVQTIPESCGIPVSDRLCGGTSRCAARQPAEGSAATHLVYDLDIVDNGWMAHRRSDTNEVAALLGPLGAEVMDVLWAASEPLTVRAVLDRLNRDRVEALAYTTVMTVLTRLTERGAASRSPAGRGYAYAPAIKDVAELAVRDVVRDHGDAALTYFVDQAGADPALRSRLRRLLAADDAEEDRKGT